MYMERLRFFDACSWVGENYLSPAHSVQDDQLVKMLGQRREKFGIGGTILSHHLSLFYWPRDGNDLLAQKLEEADGALYGAMLFEQEYFVEPGLFAQGLKKRFAQKFRMLRLFPKSNKYPFEEKLMSPFYKVLDHYHFPVMIGLEEIDITGNKAVQWEKIAQIAQKFVHMPLILDGQNAKCLLYNSYFFALMRTFPNIYLSTHNLYGVAQLEGLAKGVGAHRFLFDSNYPYQQIGLGVNRIREADLSRHEIEAVAGGNMETLIANIQLGQAQSHG